MMDIIYIYSHNTQAGGFGLAYRDMMLGMQDLWHSLAGGNLDAVQMQWFRERPKEMLFDTVADPSEINNLAENLITGKGLSGCVQR
jgi:hypothetical protein